MDQQGEERLRKHESECEAGLVEQACKYCKELVIPMFVEEHYAECLAKINHDFEKMMVASTGMMVSLRKKPNKHECCICCLPIEQFQSKRFLECTHVFHSQCIEQWLLRSSDCPYCRVVIT